MQYLLKRFVSNAIVGKLKRLSANVSGYLGLSEKRNYSIILLYHSIGEQCANDYLKLRISPEVFDEQLAYLYEKKYKVVPLGELINNLNPEPRKNVSITFDDGYLDNLELAMPILKKYNFPATIFIATDYLNGKRNGDNYWEKWEYLTTEELKRLTSLKIEVGSHSCSHRILTFLDSSIVINEISSSKKILEDIIQKKITLFSYPHGIFNQKIKKLLHEDGYLAACTSVIGFNNEISDLYELRRIEIRSDDSLREFKDKLEGYYNWLGYFQRRRYYKKV